MKDELKNRLIKNNGIKFFVYPIVFCLSGFIIIMISFGSVIKQNMDNLNLFLLPSPPKFEDYVASNIKANSMNKIEIPNMGDQLAILVIQSAGINAPVFYGDSPKELNKGVGCYTGAGIPGQKRTILLGAHNNTYFANLGQAKPGSTISITTRYGEYKYEIQSYQVAAQDDTNAYDLLKREENLILYTCYPFDCLGLTNDRYFVYAKYLSGPQES